MRRPVFFCILLLPLLLTGCFMLPEEVPALPPPQIVQPSERTLSTVPVARGDVRLEANPIAVYMPARVEIQRFAANGLPVMGIFVSFGDEVLEGDILAALELTGIHEELYELNSRHTRLNLELELLNQRYELARRLAEESGEPMDDTPFAALRGDLRAELDLLERLMVHVDNLNEDRYLRATMDGVITNVAAFSEGMLTNTRVAIAVISDRAFSSFVVQGPMAELMYPGDRFEMTLEDEIFLMEVVNPDDFGFIRAIQPLEEGDNVIAEAFLAFVDAPPQGNATRGMVHMPFEEVLDVLYIPVSALHRHEGRQFVYIIEDGLRLIRDVVTGFEGEGYIEIVSGLVEGELVLK